MHLHPMIRTGSSRICGKRRIEGNQTILVWHALAYDRRHIRDMGPELEALVTFADSHKSTMNLCTGVFGCKEAIGKDADSLNSELTSRSGPGSLVPGTGLRPIRPVKNQRENVRPIQPGYPGDWILDIPAAV